MTSYDANASFKTLLMHFEAHPFDIAQTLTHIEEMNQKVPNLKTFLNRQRIPFSGFKTTYSKSALIDTAPHPSLFLVPYLVALYEFRHLKTPYRSFIQTEQAPSEIGFHQKELFHVLEALFKVGVNLNATLPEEDSALHLATYSNDLPLVSFLMQHGADLCLTNLFWLSPVHAATKNNQLDLVRLLLDLGVSPDFRADPAQKSSHPLIVYAATQGHIEMLDLLYEYKASVNRDPHSNLVNSPLCSVIKNGLLELDQKIKVVSWLLEHGADVKDQHKDASIPLHDALSEGHKTTAITELLIGHGADVNLQNCMGSSPLHIAVLGNSMDLASLLLSHGSDPELRNANKETPLVLAQKLRRPAELIYLLKAASLVLKEKKMLSEVLESLPSPRSPDAQDLTSLASPPALNPEDTQTQSSPSKRHAL